MDSSLVGHASPSRKCQNASPISVADSIASPRHREGGYIKKVNTMEFSSVESENSALGESQSLFSRLFLGVGDMISINISCGVYEILKSLFMLIWRSGGFALWHLNTGGYAKKASTMEYSLIGYDSSSSSKGLNLSSKIVDSVSDVTWRSTGGFAHSLLKCLRRLWTSCGSVQLLVPLQSSVCSCSSDPAPLPLVTTKSARCLVLDNDETLGSFALGSLLYAMYINLCDSPPPIDLFVEKYLRAGGGRPGSISLLQTAAKMLRRGQLDHIVMFTAASNANGWVTFLRECMEVYAGIPAGTISHIIALEQCLTCDKTTGRVIKDLRRICTDTSNVVMVDDKPEYVEHGRVIKVPEYHQHVDIRSLVDQLPCPEKDRDMARRALAEDEALHGGKYSQSRKDNTMYEVTEVVASLFSSTPRE